MKGWRLSAIPKGSTPDRALSGRILCRTSDRSACLFPRAPGPRPRAHDPGIRTRGCSWTPGSLFLRNCGSRPPSRTNDAQASAILKTAPALHLIKEARGTGNEHRRTNEQPRGEHAMPILVRRSKPELASKRKNACGGRRKSLKRLDLRKTNAWISFRFSLDFLPKKLGFPSGEIWISFNALAPEF